MAMEHGHMDFTALRPAEFWEQRYADTDQVWSGRVNETFSELVEGWIAGRSLDLGCGEGGDVLWLAEQGWDATGIDLSPTAVSRAQLVAADRGLANANFVVEDLSSWADEGGPARREDGAEEMRSYDLVSASFFQSPVELQREHILRAAASRVSAGGHLVVISHAVPPGGAEGHPGHFVSPEEELEVLALDPDEWRILVSEVRRRSADRANGRHTLDDTVVVAQRIAESSTDSADYSR